jgi:hypothetical protein
MEKTQPAIDLNIFTNMESLLNPPKVDEWPQNYQLPPIPVTDEDSLA